MATIEFIGHVRLAFQGEREGTAALTCGQRDTWTWVNTDNAGAILGVPISLPKGTKMADITAAVGILLIRHETLRTTFVSTDATTEPVQSVAASGEFLIDVHRIVTPEPGSDLDTFYSDVEASLVSELRAKGLNLAVDPSFRVAVAIQDDIPRAAAIAASHMTMDFGSLFTVVQQFTELVTMSIAGVPLDPGPLGHQPLDQAAVEQSGPGQARFAAAAHYWGNCLRDAPQALLAVPKPEQPDEGCVRLSLGSPAGGAALRAIAARTGVGTSAVLLSAVCTVVALYTGTRQCVFEGYSGNRYLPGLRHYIGDLAMDIIMTLEISGSSFDDVIRRTGIAVIKANKHGLYDWPSLSRTMDEINHNRGTRFTRDFVFNNLASYRIMDEIDRQTALRSTDSQIAEASTLPKTSVPTATNHDQLTQLLSSTTISWVRVDPIPEILICLPLSLEPVLQAIFSVNTRYLARAQAEEILKAVERLLVAAAFEVLPLAQLGEVIDVQEVSRGADWQRINSSWVELSAVRQLVRDAIGSDSVSVAVQKSDDATGPILVAHIPSTATIKTPQAAHAACMKLTVDKYTAMAPGYYILCDGSPADPHDEAAWRQLPVVAEGSGRRPPIAAHLP